MSALAEKIHLPHDRMAMCRYGAVALAASLLAYYCVHPVLFAGEEGLTLLQSGRTYAVILVSVCLIAFLLIPNRLSDRMNRVLSWVWFAVAPFAIYFSLLYLNATKFNIKFFELNRIALVLTFVFLFTVQGILYGLTGSIRFSVLICAVSVAVLGIANCFVISFRGMALSGADLMSVGTAATVAGEYTYKLDWYMYMELLLTFVICAVSLKLRGGRMARPAVRVGILAVWLVAAYAFFYLCCRTDYLEEHDIRPYGFTHQLRYKEYDMLFTTLTTCFGLSVEAPDGYSVERVREIAEPYVEAAGDAGDAVSGGAKKNVGSTVSGDADGAAAGSVRDDTGTQAAAAPNIIVIMNESLADYTDIGEGLALSEDCMPFIHSLTENTIKGNAYASIFGGNTPNSEYEFLTGNTMAFLPSSTIGFHLYVRGELPSVASELKESGYSTLAVHPYRGTNYRRNIVYPQIGFDTYLTRTEFQDAEYIRSFISDQCMADRLIQEYEANQETGKPFFGYGVTVQNHGGYYASNVTGIPMTIRTLDEDIDRTQTEIYLNLIRMSDEMFESLVSYFEEQEEPTVILMFGDHQANLGDNTYRHLIGDEAGLSQEELMEKYKIPFVIWANYDIPEETIERTSLNYLYSIMADRLGLPMTGYQRYLLDLQKEVPVINTLGYWGSDGKFYDLDDESSPYYEMLGEYRIVQYNDIFGKKNRYLPFLTLSGG